MNQHLKVSDRELSITNLRSGLQDGLVLIELMKIVSPESIQFIRFVNNKLQIGWLLHIQQILSDLSDKDTS